MLEGGEEQHGFGGLLREQRIAAGLTQEALARRAGLGVRTVQGLERGEGRPRAGRTTSASGSPSSTATATAGSARPSSAAGRHPRSCSASVRRGCTRGSGRPAPT